MACNLTLGRSLPCKDVIGGIKALYFGNTRPVVGYDATNTEVIDDLGTYTVYQYLLPNNGGSLTNTGNVSEENGTVYYAQELTVNLPKMSYADHKELAIMSQQKPRVFVLDNNDNLFMMGLDFGCKVAVTAQTGTAKGDASGYVLTVSAEEKKPANFLLRTAGPDTVDYPFDNITGTITITT